MAPGNIAFTWICAVLQISNSMVVDEVNDLDEADELVDVTTEEALSLLQADLTNEVIVELLQPATQVDWETQGV